jgi:hypothetical protein
VTSPWLCPCCLERYLPLPVIKIDVVPCNWASIGQKLRSEERDLSAVAVPPTLLSHMHPDCALPYRYSADLTLGSVFGRRRLLCCHDANSLSNFFLDDALHTRFYPLSIQSSLSRPSFLLPMLPVP